MRPRAVTLGAILALCFLAGQMVPAARAASPPGPALVAQTEALLRDSIASDSKPCGPGVSQCFANGVWYSADPPNVWFCQVGPGTAAAVLWRATGRSDQRLFQLAVSTFDAAIAGHRNENGSFGEPNDSPDIASMMFGVEFGATYLELEPWLSPATRARWRRALTGIADFLISNGNLNWYTNGNINLGNAELFYLAWRASGDPRYRTAYNQAWSFALNPPQVRWPGFGLRTLSLVPSRAGYAAGFLAESGGGAPGFDPEYTELQLDVLSRLYVLSHDPRVLPVANMLVNALLPRVNTTATSDVPAWGLDTSGGTRHAQQGRHVPFTTPALAVLGWLAGRRDLAAMLPSQLLAIDQFYRGALTYSSPGMYRGLGNQVAVILQAALAGEQQAAAAKARSERARRTDAPSGRQIVYGAESRSSIGCSGRLVRARRCRSRYSSLRRAPPGARLWTTATLTNPRRRSGRRTRAQ